MKIRAITIGQFIPFFDIQKFESYIESKYPYLSRFCSELENEFKRFNLEVQTKRICTQPIFSNKFSLQDKLNLNEKLTTLQKQISILEKYCNKYNFDYFSSCITLGDELKEINYLEEIIISEIPKMLIKKEKFFSSMLVASTLNGINLTALKYCAKIIKHLSELNPFNNLKFCVSSNVKQNTPFFPAAYHLSQKPKFSLALEMADEVVDVFENSKTLSEAKVNLKRRFNKIYELLTKISNKISRKYKIEFFGLDFSPAPYPTLDKSIGTAIEKLGFEHFGALGSLIAVFLIKNCIPKNKEKIIGFSGFMQPVLEDFTIANRLSENKLNLETLLLYSTICGTGLDCIPLPGDITEKELFYMLLDICTISISHNKPLTARLMPIPSKKAGDNVEFDFEYFARSKVMDFRRLTNIEKNDLFHKDEKRFNF